MVGEKQGKKKVNIIIKKAAAGLKSSKIFHQSLIGGMKGKIFGTPRKPTRAQKGRASHQPLAGDGRFSLEKETVWAKADKKAAAKGVFRKMTEKAGKKAFKKEIKEVGQKPKKMAKKEENPKKAKKGKGGKEGKGICVTSALPYANGPIHIGHLVEYIQTDIFVRFLKLTGRQAIYCCADDTHGTPIQLNAEKEGIPPEEFVKRWYKEHIEDFKSFLIDFDIYYTTHSRENKEYADYFFNTLRKRGFIYARTVERTYCEYCAKFLPDRYIKGICPKCGAEDQYGDVCEKCNSAYTPNELIEPHCAICKNPPVKRRSLHYFFKLSAFSKKLKQWITGNKSLQPEIKNFVLNWIKEGLDDWDISRDGPYFGFKIPGEDNKYYYVWLDAPIGYISSSAHYCNTHKQNLDDYWKRGDVIHFIGKDIVYFHFLFWPAMLMGIGFKLPKTIIVHGFLTVNNEKMSKSRGTFFTARDFTRISTPEFLRFYYASSLTNNASDIDLDFKDYKAVINSQLVANMANFIYRVLSFCNKNFDSMLSVMPKSVFEKDMKGRVKNAKMAYEGCRFREAIKEIGAIASLGNKYFQDNEPWKGIKSNREEAQKTVTFCANAIKDLVILLKPVLPNFCSSIEKQLNLKSLSFSDLDRRIENHRIGTAEIIVTKIEKIEPEKRITGGWPLDLRVAKVVKVENHPSADRLYVIQLEPQRQIVGGIKEYYSKEELLGKNIIIIKNLTPATIRGVESQGMLMAADDGKQIRVIEAPNSSPGDAVYPDGVAYDRTETISFQEFTKIELKTKAKRVVYNNKVLRTDQEEVTADIEDDAVVR